MVIRVDGAAGGRLGGLLACGFCPRHPMPRHPAAMTTSPLPYTNQVYRRVMSRTNIDIDDQLVEIVMHRYGLTTKKDAVDLALRRLAGEPMTTDEVLAMQGAHLIEVDVRELSRDDL
jgi:Arc/MetJ family transcription regulator